MKTATQIKYTFKLPNKDVSFDYSFNQDDFSLFQLNRNNNKEWTKLDYYKCSHCPLNMKTHPICPLADVLDDIVTKLDEHSFDTVLVKVDMENRTVISKTTMQEALGSMMGLIIPACGCPHTLFFRPMARFHLPFSNSLETIYRASSMLLLSQYFRNKDKEVMPISLKDLDEVCDNIHIVNVQICKRLRKACEKDSSMNAIVILDTFSIFVKMASKKDFSKIESLFTPYINIKE